MWDEIEIRPVLEGDLPQLAKLQRQCFPHPIATELLERDLGENPSSAYLCACAGESMVGYGSIWVWANTSILSTLCVAPQHRGRGIGGLLLQHLMNAAAVLGAQEMSLEVLRGNGAARHLYESFGFTAVGVRHRYDSQTGEDALVMHVALKA